LWYAFGDAILSKDKANKLAKIQQVSVVVIPAGIQENQSRHGVRLPLSRE